VASESSDCGAPAGLSDLRVPRSADHGAMTKLDKPLKRELRVRKDNFVLTIDPGGLKLTRKGRRKGVEIAWKDLVNGDAAMAAALNASIGRL
jgi:hypothetical protein